ncbi:MAG: tetratricopeptide repeat protein [Bryobacterales bacterium]|nr:tetratricopeptide repeat protein [Bryobacterales bacterium]
MTAPPVRETYTRAEVRRLLALSERRLAGWERQGLTPRLGSYSFTDLVTLQALIRLRKGGASPAKIRRALAALRERFAAVEEPLKQLRLYCDRGRIAVKTGEATMEALSGQLLLDFEPGEFPAVLAFPEQAAHDALKAAEAARRYDSALWFEKGLQLESEGAPPAEMIRAYENALELDPRSTGALVNLGTVHFHLRNWAEAEEYYRRAIETDPQYALAHFNLGNLFDERGEQSKAILHYLIALRLEPGYGDAHYNLALIYQASGQVIRAVRHWKAYLRIDPSGDWADVARQELEKLRKITVIEGARGAGAKSGA